MNLIKKLPFYRRYTTSQNSNYWAKRKGWAEYQDTADHPHRHFISHILKKLNWLSLMEIGCGSGPNLINIARSISNKQLGGVDINPEAIELCQKTFKGGHFKVGDARDMLMTDKSTDIILSDSLLMYIGPRRITRYLKESARVCRNNVVLYEFHSTSFLKRTWLRIFSGRHAYNYKRRLEKLGFYDIITIKAPKFEEDNDYEFRYLIVAKPPKL